MKKIIISVLAIFFPIHLFAQNKEDKIIDSLKLAFSKQKTDTGKVNILVETSRMYSHGSMYKNNDSSWKYLNLAMNLSKRIGYARGERHASFDMAEYFFETGNYPEALKIALQNLNNIQQSGDIHELFYEARQLNWIYNSIGNGTKALEYAKKLNEIADSPELHDSATIRLYKQMAYLNLGGTLVASFSQIDAQSPVHTYEITTDTATQQFLNNNYWQVLPDKNSNFTIEEVQKIPLSDQFTYVGKTRKPAFTKTTWFRFSLKNNTGKILNLSIASNAAVADFYIPDSNGIMHHYLTGNEITWHKKDGFKTNNAIPFGIKQGQQIVIYLKTFNRASLSDTLKFPLFNTQKLERSILNNYQENYTSNSRLFSMVLCGIFFLDGIFILLIYFTVKEKIYLYFALFSFFGSLSYLRPLYSVEHVNFLLSETIGSISYLWSFFMFQFVRNYLQVAKHYPRWHKWIRFIANFFFAVLIVRTFFLAVYFYDIRISNWFLIIPIIQILFWLSFIITIIIFLLKITGETRMFLIGVLPLTVCLLSETLVEIGAIFSVSIRNFEINSVMLFGYANGITSVWLMVIISWTLFKRFANQEKKLAQEKFEKEQLAKEQEIQKRELIAQQKVELEKQVMERTSELKQSLQELKGAQAQLIQSEKMASLGELTAGIAHEIQNPLNFVNNFSDVNKELLQELKEEADKGNIEEIKSIADDVIGNEEKINHHGKRADAIVKGMLQHSRKSSGQKEATDINALADEYLRLSYHGLRAKDKNFNAEIKTDFDNSIGKINIIPQDIGRVLLNLFNNAFYAVNEQKNKNLISYEPKVFVRTQKCDHKIYITVRDNGNGIPQKILDKIFQPFFTTKPTGQGTGLGLSLSYDIIKAHGGEIKVESKEGEGTEFIITIPVS